MSSDQDFGEIIFFQIERYIGETSDSINHKERGSPLPESFGPTKLYQSSAEVFFSYQFPEHLLITISLLFPVPGKLLDGKLIVRRCDV